MVCAPKVLVHLVLAVLPKPQDSLSAMRCLISSDRPVCFVCNILGLGILPQIKADFGRGAFKRAEDNGPQKR